MDVSTARLWYVSAVLIKAKQQRPKYRLDVFSLMITRCLWQDTSPVSSENTELIFPTSFWKDPSGIVHHGPATLLIFIFKIQRTFIFLLHLSTEFNKLLMRKANKPGSWINCLLLLPCFTGCNKNQNSLWSLSANFRVKSFVFIYLFFPWMS